MLFWFENDANSVMSITQFVYLLSHRSSRHAGFDVGLYNFRQSVTMFAMKRMTIDHWNIHDDMFCAPNEN